MGLALISLLVIGGILFILNCIATYIVWNTYFEVKERRKYQTLFIWLVPLIGSFMTIYINREDYFAEKNKLKIGNNPNITDSQAIGMGYHSDGGR